jgi:hypothetical protein
MSIESKAITVRRNRTKIIPSKLYHDQIVRLINGLKKSINKPYKNIMSEADRRQDLINFADFIIEKMEDTYHLIDNDFDDPENINLALVKKQDKE